MPPKPRARATKAPPKRVCQHSDLLTSPSAHAISAGYTQPPASQRAKAQGTKPDAFVDRPSTFPAPLILPSDDLALDPKHPPQSVLAWTRLKERNHVTPRRRTVYMVPPPSSSPEAPSVSSWTRPRSAAAPPYPDIEAVAAYTRAFYHPLPVTVLPTSLTFVPWSADSDLIGLQSRTEVVGVRTRSSDSGFARQLNLDDLLDAAIAILPADAYALVMIVNHDLYEDEDDEFVCGRAYGGSRVAVVSTARYNPVLDGGLGLDVRHVWPASHCWGFVEGVLGAEQGEASKVTGSTLSEAGGVDGAESPLRAAVDAVRALRESNNAGAASYSYLARVCRTVSHELAHCFGIGHCTYYACVMQGSASLLEDARQPMYLCPVDMIKVLRATGASEEEWMTAMLEFCERFAQDETFVGLGAWLKARRGE